MSPSSPFTRLINWKQRALWNVTSKKRKKWQCGVKRASCGPFLSFSLPGPPFSLTPIHYGYCQVPDKNHCASSSYSQEDRRQKEWQTHVKIYWRKTNAPSFCASSCRESALLATLSFGELLSQQGTRDRRAHSSYSKCCDVWTVTADRNYIWCK